MQLDFAKIIQGEGNKCMQRVVEMALRAEEHALGRAGVLCCGMGPSCPGEVYTAAALAAV